ncbi:hypothetical protein QC763_0059500 [Podospora pseudopauciseta]|uniref:Uncharacterized protein n=1 Tax=Podospora pseudopauciseta TaxID=2093780 RepID=A0ABR0HHU4_9PEZI|nr:hypothetical protein QC763_0059500 [Podospora pseudopauciseta]
MMYILWENLPEIYHLCGFSYLCRTCCPAPQLTMVDNVMSGPFDIKEKRLGSVERRHDLNCWELIVSSWPDFVSTRTEPHALSQSLSPIPASCPMMDLYLQAD